MKRAIILIFLPVFLYSIIGWQWVFALRLYSHQIKEWTTNFDDEDLEVITLNENARHQDTFLVNGHELYHHGKYFDIKYKKRRGDEIVFYCHPDNEEDELYVSVGKQIKDDQGMTTCSKQKLLKIVKISDFASDPHTVLFNRKEICIAFLYNTPRKSNLRGNSVFVPPDVDAQVS